MQVPVRADGHSKQMTIEFADAMPASLIGEWSAALDAGSTGPEWDSVEFLESAVSKWALYERKGRLVRSLEELQARVEQHPQGEMLGVLIASAGWYRHGAVAGFCAFRRTWSNNLVFDFLGVLPSLLVPATRDLSGVGTGLLYGIGRLSVALDAGLIWAETTDTSAAFYERLFNLGSLGDLLVVNPEVFLKPLASAIETPREVQ
jgi:hypothetical protein